MFVAVFFYMNMFEYKHRTFCNEQIYECTSLFGRVVWLWKIDENGKFSLLQSTNLRTNFGMRQNVAISQALGDFDMAG